MKAETIKSEKVLRCFYVESPDRKKTKKQGQKDFPADTPPEAARRSIEALVGHVDGWHSSIVTPTVSEREAFQSEKRFEEPLFGTDVLLDLTEQNDKALLGFVNKPKKRKRK